MTSHYIELSKIQTGHLFLGHAQVPVLPSFEVLLSLPEMPSLPITTYSNALPNPLARVEELPSVGAPIANQVSSLFPLKPI